MKRIFKIVLLVLLSLTLVGCGDEVTLNEVVSNNYKYSINSQMDLLVVKNLKYNNNNELTNYSYLEVKDNNSYIKNDYLTNLELGNNIIEITLSNTNYAFDILITNEDKPYLVNHLDVNYIEGKDLNLVVDMMGYSFHSL